MSHESATKSIRFDARIVVEVLSSDYAGKDLVVAPVEYARLARLEQYVVIDSRPRSA